MNPERQYYSMIENFRSGNRDTLMMESLTSLAIQNENGFLADSVIRAWLAMIKNVYTTDRLKMIAQIEIKPGSPEFDLFYHNAEKIDRILKPDFAENIVMNAIIQHNQSILKAFTDPASLPTGKKYTRKSTVNMDLRWHTGLSFPSNPCTIKEIRTGISMLKI